MAEAAHPPATDAPNPLSSVESIIAGLAGVGYIASRRIATALFMAAHLQKPVLVEGMAGVGKTELALATAALLDLPLIRLQCYEGLDESKALYEWKYGKQLLYTQILKDRMGERLADAPDMASGHGPAARHGRPVLLRAVPGAAAAAARRCSRRAARCC